MQRFVPSFRIDAGNLLRVLPLAMSLISLTLAAPAMAQEQLPRTLTVTGRGIESIPTTLTQVNLGVEVQGKTAAEVQQEVAQRSSAVIELLKSRNVEKLETTGISLNPVYSYEDNVQRLTGYAGTNTVSFRLDTPSAGSLLDEAVKAGATRIDGISFVAADSAIAAAQKQALREAVEEANQQADAVLSALNFTKREVVGIQINDAAPPQPPIINYAVQAERADKAASTPVIAGEQKVEASVTLQIRY
ncbi:MAG: SIMPL domain-containing protein [Microcoleus vaginatus WJT46-NPBG5]|jgi:uncharacterized protein YggE|nr:SIMPL domain-containing protein [Microcoleus vaginatus WJT46-NPBG5]